MTKIDLKVIPILSIMYLLAFLDRYDRGPFPYFPRSNHESSGPTLRMPQVQRGLLAMKSFRQWTVLMALSLWSLDRSRA